MVLELVRLVEVGDGGLLRLQARGRAVRVHPLLLAHRPDQVHVRVRDGVVCGPIGGQLLPEENGGDAVLFPGQGRSQVILAAPEGVASRRRAVPE